MPKRKASAKSRTVNKRQKNFGEFIFKSKIAAKTKCKNILDNCTLNEHPTDAIDHILIQNIWNSHPKIYLGDETKIKIIASINHQYRSKCFAVVSTNSESNFIIPFSISKCIDQKYTHLFKTTRAIYLSRLDNPPKITPKYITDVVEFTQKNTTIDFGSDGSFLNELHTKLTMNF